MHMATLITSTSRVWVTILFVFLFVHLWCADLISLLGGRNYPIKNTNLLLSIAWNNDPVPVDPAYGRLLLVEAVAQNCKVITEQDFGESMAMTKHDM